MTVTQQLKYVFSESWQFYRNNWKSLFKAMIVSGGIYLLIGATQQYIISGIKVNSVLSGGSIDAQVPFQGFTIYFIVSTLAVLYCIIHMMIVIHRMALLGIESVSELGGSMFTMRHVWFIVRGLAFGLYMLVPALLVASFGEVVIKIAGLTLTPENLIYYTVILIFVFSCLVSRTYLVFPSAAINGKVGVFKSGRLTANTKIMMLISTIFVAVVSSYLSDFLQGNLQPYSMLGPIVGFVTATLLFFPVFVFQVILLSHAYLISVKESADIIEKKKIVTGLESVQGKVVQD